MSRDCELRLTRGSSANRHFNNIFFQHRGLYFVKWKGWPESDNTWEPIGNLEECKDKLKEFYHQRIKDRESATPVRWGKILTAA